MYVIFCSSRKPVIDLTHNDVKQCFRSSNLTCIEGVVVTDESNMASSVPRSGIKMAVMLKCVLMWMGLSVGARAICLSFQIDLDPVLLLFLPLQALLAAILDLSVTTTPILPFGACYVIMHKAYSILLVLLV